MATATATVSPWPWCLGRKTKAAVNGAMQCDAASWMAYSDLPIVAATDLAKIDGAASSAPPRLHHARGGLESLFARIAGQKIRWWTLQACMRCLIYICIVLIDKPSIHMYVGKDE